MGVRVVRRLQRLRDLAGNWEGLLHGQRAGGDPVGQGRTFDELEHRGREALYAAWQEKSEGERYGTSYQQLYIELEEILSTAMQRDRDDRHSRVERGWMLV